MNEKLILEKLTKHDEILADHSEQLAFIRENMVLRQDLEQFATKEELKQFATKEDLKQFATKKDLETYATKEDLHELEDRLMTALDRQMVILQRLDQERIFINLHLQRHDNEIAQIKGH